MNKALIITENILYPLIMAGLTLVTFPLIFNLEIIGLTETAETMLIIIGLLANFIASVVLIVDVFKNNLSLKYFWTLSFLFLGGLAGFVYLRNREQYLTNR